MCKRVSAADMNKVAELANRAKGDRTNAAFAEACGVNAATMSRILNAKFKKRLSDDVIAAIAVNSADSSVTFFRELLAAQGVAIPAAEGKDEKEQKQLYTEYLNQVRSAWQMSTRTRTDQPAISSVRKDNIRIRTQEIIQNCLIDKGFMVARVKDLAVMENVPMQFNRQADFVLKTDALETEGLSKWAFYISENAGLEFLRDFQNLLVEAYFSKPAQNGYRVTLITSDWHTFYESRSCLKGLGSAYDSVSIMLVDTRYNLVKAEYVAPRDGMEVARVMPEGMKDGEWEQDAYGVPDD